MSRDYKHVQNESVTSYVEVCYHAKQTFTSFIACIVIYYNCSKTNKCTILQSVTIFRELTPKFH